MKYVAHDLGNIPYARIYDLADLHRGDKKFNEKALLDDVKTVEEDPYGYAFMGGDYGNFVTPGSKGELDEADANNNEQIEYTIELCKRLGDKLLGIIDGNHPFRVKKAAGIRPGQIVASAVGKKHLYSEDTLYLVLRMGHRDNGKPWVYSIYAKHGSGGGLSTGSKAAEIERGANTYLAHVYWNAHTHGKMIFDDLVNVPDFRLNKMVPWRRLFMRTASYLDYPSYAEEKGYRMTPLGSPELLLSGRAFWYDASLLPRRNVPGLSA